MVHEIALRHVSIAVQSDGRSREGDHHTRGAEIRRAEVFLSAELHGRMGEHGEHKRQDNHQQHAHLRVSACGQSRLVA